MQARRLPALALPTHPPPLTPLAALPCLPAHPPPPQVFYEATPEILSLTVCTQAQEAGQATCKGDSGGPLVVDRDGGRTLVGALSWGTSATCIDAPEDATDYFASLVNSDSREWVGQQLEQLGGGDA